MVPDDMHIMRMPSRICVADDVVAELTEYIHSLGRRHVLVLHGTNNELQPYVRGITAALGSRVAAVEFDLEKPTNSDTRRRVGELVAQHRVDAVVSLGGGSVIDAGKCAVFDSQQRLPLITLATTLSGAEFTPDCGVIDLTRNEKYVLRDDRLVATGAFYSTTLLARAPIDLILGSGANAISHCVEALYVNATNSILQAMALDGLLRIMEGIKSISAGLDDERRAGTALAFGTIAGGIVCGNAGIALHHITCHHLAPAAGLSHGEANALMVPEAFRFNIIEDADPSSQVNELARRFNTDFEQILNSLNDLFREFRTRTLARARPISDGAVEAMAVSIAQNDRVLKNNPRAVVPSDIEAILHRIMSGE